MPLMRSVIEHRAADKCRYPKICTPKSIRYAHPARACNTYPNFLPLSLYVRRHWGHVRLLFDILRSVGVCAFAHSSIDYLLELTCIFFRVHHRLTLDWNGQCALTLAQPVNNFPKHICTYTECKP